MKIYCSRARFDIDLDSIIGKDIWVYGWARDFGTKWFRILRKSDDLFIVNVLPLDYTKLRGEYPNFEEVNLERYSEPYWSINPEQYNRVVTKTYAIRDNNFRIDDLVKPRTSEELIDVVEYYW